MKEPKKESMANNSGDDLQLNNVIIKNNPTGLTGTITPADHDSGKCPDKKILLKSLTKQGINISLHSINISLSIVPYSAITTMSTSFGFE